MNKLWMWQWVMALSHKTDLQGHLPDSLDIRKNIKKTPVIIQRTAE
jgi:hypothetical protein